MDEELAARVRSGARIVVLGSGASITADSFGAREHDVTYAVHPAAARVAGPFDVALVTEFREEWKQPRDVLHELRPALRDGGRVLISLTSAAPAAIRVAVYGESLGESTGPLVRDVDLDRFAARTCAELLAAAGYRAVPGTPEDRWLEGIAPEDGAAGTEREAPVAVPDGDAQLAAARTELGALHAFVATVLERQRRLHEELARLRSGVAVRDASLAALQRRADEAAAATALAQERRVELDAAHRRLAEAEARIADLEARRQRLTQAVIELRER